MDEGPAKHSALAGVIEGSQMETIETRKARRFLYLRHLYEAVNDKTLLMCNRVELGTELGWDQGTTDSVVDYLRDKGLVKTLTFGSVSITHEGIDAIENALSNPSQPTHYFPCPDVVVVIQGNIVFNGDVIGRDKTTTTTAGGDVVGRDKTAPDKNTDS
jgi:hypothetical protein